MKLAMALATAVESKNDAVSSFGIGEDLNQCLYGWKGDELVVVARMTMAMKGKAAEDRFFAVAGATSILRQGWGVDAVTMVAEGYVSDDPEGTEGFNLSQEFARGNKSVKEAITIVHVKNDEVSFVTKAYSYEVPKRVVWEEEVFVPGRQRIVGKDGMYPMMFSKALELPLMGGEHEGSEFYDTLAMGMVKYGFETRSML